MLRYIAVLVTVSCVIAQALGKTYLPDGVSVFSSQFLKLNQSLFYDKDEFSNIDASLIHNTPQSYAQFYHTRAELTWVGIRDRIGELLQRVDSNPIHIVDMGCGTATIAANILKTHSNTIVTCLELDHLLLTSAAHIYSDLVESKRLVLKHSLAQESGLESQSADMILAIQLFEVRINSVV